MGAGSIAYLVHALTIRCSRRSTSRMNRGAPRGDEAQTKDEARRIADFLTESLDPAHAVCAVFEAPSGGWQVEVHFIAPVEAAGLRSLVRLVASGDCARPAKRTVISGRDLDPIHVADSPKTPAVDFTSTFSPGVLNDHFPKCMRRRDDRRRGDRRPSRDVLSNPHGGDDDCLTSLSG